MPKRPEDPRLTKIRRLIRQIAGDQSLTSRSVRARLEAVESECGVHLVALVKPQLIQESPVPERYLVRK